MDTAVQELRDGVSRGSLQHIAEPLRYCLYARKSSEADERQALSIDSQIKEMIATAQKEGLDVVEIRKESHSAKDSGMRPVFKQLLDDISQDRFDGILTWAPDRLSRNGGDLGRIIDLMDQGFLKQIRTHSQAFANSPNEKFLLMILCSQAKLENDNRGINVKRGLRTKCEMGVRPGCVPLGYKLVRSENFKSPSKTIIDTDRAPFIKKMFKYINSGVSGRQVNEYLTDEGFRTKKGKTVTLSMTYRILKEPFYYGEFEYPKGSGNWYKGSHTPLISKEEFEEAQKNLKVVEKGQWGRKEFYFSKLFKCGHCGSGISGEERINRHGKRYIYYKCNKYGGRKVCRSKYLREEKIVESLAEIVDELKENRFRLSQRIGREVEKMNDMQMRLHGDDYKSISSKEYIEFILTKGTKPEKKEILKGIESQLFIEDGSIKTKKSSKKSRSP